MLVKDLKKFLELCPDDATVVTEGFDHSFNVASFSAALAFREKNGSLYEYFNVPGFINEDDVVEVVLIT